MELNDIVNKNAKEVEDFRRILKMTDYELL